MSKSRAMFVDLLIFIALAAGLSWYLVHLAMQRFDFFDMSGFLDAGYRVSIGQVPYVDFFYHSGPIHLYLHALSFKLLGFNKYAVLTHLVVGHMVVLGIAYFLARRALSRLAAAVIVVAVSLSFFAPTAHPWYDQTASIFVLVGVLLIDLTYPFATKRRAWGVSAACGALVALAFMTKANIALAAGPALFAVFVVAALQRRDWRPVVGYCVGFAIGMALVMLTLASPMSFVRHNFLEYKTGTRFKNFDRLIQILKEPSYAIYAIAIIALAIFGGVQGLRSQLHRWVLVLGLLFIAIFSAWTGSMEIQANIVLHGIIVLLLWLIAASIPPRVSDEAPWDWRRESARVAVWLLAGWCAVNAWRHRLTTWDWRASNADAKYNLRTPAFAGWKCNGQVGAGLDVAVTYVIEHVPADESLFVFPDCTMIYGLTGRDSFRGAAFIWDVLYEPPKGVYEEFRQRFLKSPPEWMLVHDQTEIYFFMAKTLLEHLKLEDFIVQNYRVVWQQGEFKMLRLKKEPTTAPTTEPTK